MSLQYSGCFWFPGPAIRSSSVESRFGIDAAPTSTSTSADFFLDMKDHILSFARRLNEGDTKQRDKQPLSAVVVAGEAATNPEFLRVVHAVVDELSGILARDGGDTGTTTGKSIELIMPEGDDGTWAGAKGAAMWMEARLNKSYCDEWNARYAPGVVFREGDAVGDGHADL